MVTNSGHEIGGRGAHHLVEDVAPPPEEVKCWLHFGSGVGTWRHEDTPEGPRRIHHRGGIKNFATHEKFVDILKESFAHIPDLEPRTGEMKGELQRYFAEGYAAFGFYGSNMHKHAISDGPEQTAPEILEPLARGAAAALTKIELM